MVLHYILALLAGTAVKAVDWLEDDIKSRSFARYALAVVYGTLIGYVISTSSFGVIFLAALVGQVFARKVDTVSHRVGLFVAAASLLWLGFPPLDIGLFAIFVFLAFMDEMDYIGRLRFLEDWRLFLKLGALVPAIAGVWDYFIGVMAFDIGYEGFRWAAGRLAPIGPSVRPGMPQPEGPQPSGKPAPEETAPKPVEKTRKKARKKR